MNHSNQRYVKVSFLPFVIRQLPMLYNDLPSTITNDLFLIWAWVANENNLINVARLCRWKFGESFQEVQFYYNCTKRLSECSKNFTPVFIVLPKRLLADCKTSNLVYMKCDHIQYVVSPSYLILNGVALLHTDFLLNYNSTRVPALLFSIVP